ncbi:MAG: hypothetical protein H6713_00545 [Myxococcales bacterium]|nr:hypothetical protein [Myxococcales bacterium]MCB9748470.1 hypothetical protein [Myxococcales bacterium]
MWIIIGDRSRTEPVAGGATARRPCPKCGAMATFHEHRVLKTFRLYFVDILNHDARHVMVCGRCHAAFITDEVAGRRPELDQRGTVVGALQGAARRTRDVATSGAIGDAVRKGRAAIESGAVTEQLGDAAAQSRDALRRLWNKRR